MDATLYSFGQWLKQRRSVLHLTQEQLAKRVHCATVTIRKIEGDIYRPSPAVAERLAAALELSLDMQQLFCNVARAAVSYDTRVPCVERQVFLEGSRSRRCDRYDLVCRKNAPAQPPKPPKR